MPAEAVLASNLKHPDYVSIVCGSLNQLPQAFARLDEDEQNRRQKGLSLKESTNLEHVLQLSSASLSTADRRVVRREQMNQRVIKAARSRAPRMVRVNFENPTVK